jgi:hypothetical protein
MNAHAPYWHPVLAGDFCKECGDDWPCWHWRQAHPRCRCSHPRDAHGLDRKHRPMCFGSTVCGCAQYREKDQ